MVLDGSVGHWRSDGLFRFFFKVVLVATTNSTKLFTVLEGVYQKNIFKEYVY